LWSGERTVQTPTIETRCPNCDGRVTVVEDAPREERLWTIFTTAEATCPACGWEFVADSNGNVFDDGDLDREPLFEIDTDGELCSGDLLAVTCQRCGHPFETEPDTYARCPHCQRHLALPEGVPADEDQWAYANHRVDHELDCECDFCDCSDDWDESQSCPNCG